MIAPCNAQVSAYRRDPFRPVQGNLRGRILACNATRPRNVSEAVYIVIVAL